jgi:hypothetical protein
MIGQASEWINCRSNGWVLGVRLRYVKLCGWVNECVGDWLDKCTKFKTMQKAVRFKNLDDVRDAF